MKVIHVNFSGSGGGAAIAAQRINRALNTHCPDVDSELWCVRKAVGADAKCLKNTFQQRLDSLELSVINRLLNGGEHSINLLPSSFIGKLNQSDADIVNLHWINGELFSIEQLARIKKPIVWTFHDMWPFCGSEHYSEQDCYIHGYEKTGCVPEKFPSKKLMYLARWVYARKKKSWKNLKIHVVCPSHWLEKCTKQSLLFRDQSVSCIHNCVDLERFKPLADRMALRRKYGLPEDRNIILFGAVNPAEKRKGWDLLRRSLVNLEDRGSCALAIFGSPFEVDLDGLDIHWFGRISDEHAMAEIYNCADVMCVPSRMDNLPNTAVEAQSCGLPVVAFDVGGLRDIVEHSETGYLAKPYDVDDFARGVESVLGTGAGGALSAHDRAAMSDRIRCRTTNKFDEVSVASSYQRVYAKILCV